MLRLPARRTHDRISRRPGRGERDRAIRVRIMVRLFRMIDLDRLSATCEARDLEFRRLHLAFHPDRVMKTECDLLDPPRREVRENVAVFGSDDKAMAKNLRDCSGNDSGFVMRHGMLHGLDDVWWRQ